jgi:hypothetical protein
MDTYDHLLAGNFGTIVYTVGDGVDGQSASKLNALSRANIEHAAVIAQNISDAVVFIAGGNGGSEHGRNAQERLAGSQTEAERMHDHVRFGQGIVVPIMTDCDARFREIFDLDPSHNTPENARNAARVVQKGRISEGDVVAEDLHMFRVIGTLRKELDRLNLLSDFAIRAHAVPGEFEQTNDQAHIRSEEAFNSWNFKANVHHVLTGKVRRFEFLQEWLTGRQYRHLRILD